MIKDIQYENLDSMESYADQAVKLVQESYKRECMHIHYLPDDDFEVHLRQSIEWIIKNGTGIAAISNNKLVGFLAGIKVQQLFGKCAGIYCPVFAHGAIEDHRDTIYNNLYIHAAALWVDSSCLTHAITTFAHNKQLVDTLFWNGFGARCVDAIRETALLQIPDTTFRIKKVDCFDATSLLDLHTKHNHFYRESPIFMLKTSIDPIKDHTEWHSAPNQHEWAAYDGNTPIGCICVGPEAESFVSEHSLVMNINNMFVDEHYRGKGIGALLLNTVQQWLLENNYPLCGVDFESINTIGSHFWMKYFTPYTYSVVRRIDERVLD